MPYPLAMREEDLALVHDGIDVEDVAGDEALQQVIRLLVAQALDNGPEFVLGMHFADADGAGHRPRLQHPRRRYAIEERRKLSVIQHVDEVGHVQPRLGGAHAHGQLVAEVARGGLAHAGDAQVLADHGGQFDIEIVERHDAVEHARARQIADGVAHVDWVPLSAAIRQVEDLVDRLHRPVRFMLQAFGGDQHYRPALAFAFANEIVALFVAGHAENRHNRNPAEAPTHSRSLLWSTPICAPRPMRTMVFTARISSVQMYIIRTSILAVPAGVSITGAKSTRSCSRNWLRLACGTAARSACVGPTITPSPANE